MKRMQFIKTKNYENDTGFSLAETLVVTIILLLVTAVVATGIPTAVNTYKRVVLTSNAEVLLSTTITALRNELSTAQYIETPVVSPSTPGQTIEYYNPTSARYSKIYIGSDLSSSYNEMLFKRNSDLSFGTRPEYLVTYKPPSEGVYPSFITADFYVTYQSVTFDETSGIVTFVNLSVNRVSGATELAKRNTLSIRVISN